MCEQDAGCAEEQYGNNRYQADCTLAGFPSHDHSDEHFTLVAREAVIGSAQPAELDVSYARRAVGLQFVIRLKNIFA